MSFSGFFFTVCIEIIVEQEVKTRNALLQRSGECCYAGVRWTLVAGEELSDQFIAHVVEICMMFKSKILSLGKNGFFLVCSQHEMLFTNGLLSCAASHCISPLV